MAVVQDALASHGVNAVAVRRTLRATLGKGDHPHANGEAIHRSERCRRTFAVAEGIAAEAGTDCVQAPHLFLATARYEDAHLAAAIQAGGGNQEELCKAICTLREGSGGVLARWGARRLHQIADCLVARMKADRQRANLGRAVSERFLARSDL